MRAIIRGAVYQRGCRDFVQAANGEEALNLCSHRKFDLVISEYRMAPINGLEFLSKLQGNGLARFDAQRRE
ncbi:MAG: response regulator [Acetobacteraceae bacterium]|nr:response regulator [Acetobacteraceae bacterium]